ncbi:MAG: ABC transporter ATP-binding protein [Gammaproteobacteria bacterium]
MLQIENLCVDYGPVRVVENLNLTLTEDEILMLVGPTACGKTTILQAVAGLIPIAQGRISLGNWEATPGKSIAPEKRKLGMVFQDFALFPHLTVEQNVAFRLTDMVQADHWLKLLGLDNFRYVKPGTLSGGQKQRVALARTLAHEPSLILLDEPLSNLDAALKDSLRWEIRNALKVAGVPAIWVTHDQEEALSVGDRLGVLNAGVLEQLASPEACFCEPASRFVAGFLGEASFIRGQLKGNHVSTSLGDVPATAVDEATGEVDLLLRPDDLSLAAAVGPGNAKVSWARYEGAYWLYGVALDGGPQLQIRTSHENYFGIGERVGVEVITTHALAAFAIA